MQQNIITYETRAYEHVAAMFRWILATLFTANGGAIVAVLSHSDVVSLLALGCFAVGLVLSLFVGVASIFAGLRMTTKLNIAKVVADTMLLDGVDRGQELIEKLDSFKITWKSYLPGFIGGASLLCLIAGMIAVAVSAP